MDSYSSSMARGATPRRSPGSEQSHYPKTSPSSAGSVVGSGDAIQAQGARVSSASKASSTRSNADKQLSQIEKSVTHLLVATKQLLEMLTQWSRKQAKETEVSDVYVRLGYEFNLACRAFGAIGMDTSDLGPVPDLLRTILEDTLSQDASPQSLDRYLPRIRDIIINLLHGLKKKQAKLRSRQAREGKALPPRQGSSGSFELGDGAGQQSLEHTPSTATQSPQKRPVGSHRQGAGGAYDEDQASVSSRNKSPSPWPGDRPGGSFSEREAGRQETQRSLAPSSTTTTSSSLSSFTMQNMPVVPPHADSDTQFKRPESPSYNIHNFPHPPPPLPPTSKQNDAIGMLQRSGELERRASRRFSAYQIQKHLGGSPNGIPVLPPAQNSPIPNRGQDVRESMNAVRLRGPHLHDRQRSKNRFAGAASDKTASPASHDAAHKLETTVESVASSSPLARTPTDKIRSQREFEGRDTPPSGGPSLPGGLPQIAEQDSLPASNEPKKRELSADGHTSAYRNLDKPLPSPSTPLQSHRPDYTPEHSPPPGKEITLFLQYKSKIKKYVLPEGYSGLTIARLQLAFIEKFAWNTHSNGADLPEIYIQDPVSGIRHELEDLRDIKDRSVLVLNVEVLDEVRKHFDESVGGIRSMVESVRDVIDGHGTSIQRLIDRQQETSKEISRLATPGSMSALSGSRPSATGGKAAELQGLRDDLASLRQTYSSFTSDITSSMSAIRAKASQIKSAAVDAVVPSFEGGSGAGHARVQAGKKELADESEKLVARVDDLQDLVEDLRKDVVTRGVRPLPRQLEAVGRDISAVTKELKKMQDFLKREKPIWTKIWEKELQLVCEERDQLTMQEDLAVDLEDDLEKATQTFALVEQATKQQALENPGSNPSSVVVRNVSRTMNQHIDLVDAKDSVLGEVRALQPNHESRLEAIERAEKARQRELESRRGGEFQKELSNFVGAGKLRSNGGGFEELERVRKEKEESIRKEVWERMQGLIPAEPEIAAINGETQEPEPELNSPDDQNALPDEEAAEQRDVADANDDTYTGSNDSRDNQSDRRSSGYRSSDTPVSSGKKRSSWLTAIFSS